MDLDLDIKDSGLESISELDPKELKNEKISKEFGVSLAQFGASSIKTMHGRSKEMMFDQKSQNMHYFEI